MSRSFSLRDLDPEYRAMLGHVEQEDRRLDAFLNLFVGVAEEDPYVVARAGGRVNLIGEHVDYPDLQFSGDHAAHLMSLGGSVSHSFLTGLRHRTDQKIRLFHLDAGLGFECEVSEWPDLEARSVEEREKSVPMERRCVPEWAHHTLGCISVLSREKGVDVGMDLVLSSNVPHGAGMSNSAANAVAVSLCFREGYGLKDLDDKGALVAFARRSEHAPFVGGHCGWLDQMLIVHSKKGQLTCIDYVGHQCRHFESKFPEHWQFVAINTCVPHVLAESEYPDRVRELELGIGLLRKYVHEDWGATSLSLGTYNQILKTLFQSIPPVELSIDDMGVQWDDQTIEAFVEQAKRDIIAPEWGRHIGLSVDESLAILLRRMRHQKASSLLVPLAGQYAESGDATAFGQLLDMEGQSLRMSGDFQITGDNGAQDALLDKGLGLGRELDLAVHGRMLGGGGGGNVLFFVDRHDESRYRDWLRYTCDTYNAWTRQTLGREDISAMVIEPLMSGGAQIVYK